MAFPPEVRPGDLITSDFMNRLLAELAALEGRVATLESQTTPTGNIVITSITPPGTQASPMRELSEVRIAGSNFRLSVGATRVFFNAAPVEAYKPGSNDSLLIFNVPNLPTLPVTGQLVTLRLENGQSSTVRNVLVQPAVVDIQGDVDVIFRDDISNPQPNPLAVNAEALFAYRLRSRVNLETSFDLLPVATRPDLQPLLEVLDFNRQPIAGSSINLLPGEERSFFIRIASIPEAAGNATFNLNVGAASGAVEGSDSKPFTVGQVVDPSDPTIVLSSPSFSATDASGHEVPEATFDTASNTIRLPRGVQGVLDFTVTFAGAGTYRVTAAPGPNTNNWTLRAVPPSFIETIGNQTETPRLTVRANSNQSSPTGEVVFTIAREGATLNQTRRFNLELIQI